MGGQITRIATFLGLLENADNAEQIEGTSLGSAELDAITAAAEFDAMQELFMRRNAVKEACGKKFDPTHIRKGVAGGWSEVMSRAQSDAFDRRTASCSAPVWSRDHASPAAAC